MPLPSSMLLNKLVVAGLCLAYLPDSSAQSPPWSSTDAIPGGCTPNPLVEDFGACIFSLQCSCGYCCPYLRRCLPNQGSTPVPSSVINEAANSLYRSIVWDQSRIDSGACNIACDVCEYRSGSTGANDGTSSTVRIQTCGQSSQLADLMDFNSDGVDLSRFDLAATACHCHADFVAAYQAGTWVNGCGAGTSGSTSASGGTAAPTPAPPSSIAGTLVMTSDGSVDFCTNGNQNKLKAAIASAATVSIVAAGQTSTAYTASDVTVTVAGCSGSRRLQASTQTTVTYEITTASATEAASLGTQMTTTSTFTSQFQDTIQTSTGVTLTSTTVTVTSGMGQTSGARSVSPCSIALAWVTVMALLKHN